MVYFKKSQKTFDWVALNAHTLSETVKINFLTFFFFFFFLNSFMQKRNLMLHGSYFFLKCKCRGIEISVISFENIMGNEVPLGAEARLIINHNICFHGEIRYLLHVLRYCFASHRWIKIQTLNKSKVTYWTIVLGIFTPLILSLFSLHFLIMKITLIYRHIFIKKLIVFKINIYSLSLCTYLRRVMQNHYGNTPIQIYRTFHLQKLKNFQMKNSDIFYISAQITDCGYSLEPPHWGSSNEYPQSMFLSRNKKNNVYPCIPQFYYIKVGFKGVKIT